MTSNLQLPADAYPQAFHAAIASGGAVLYAADLPWTPLTAAKRFRQLLALLRKQPGHRLYPQAKCRWRVEPSPRALVVTLQRPDQRPARLGVALIAAATARATNRQ